MKYVSVSNIDRFRRYLDGYGDLDSLIADLTRKTPSTEPMLRGKAWASAMEHLKSGEHEVIQSEGYRFIFKCYGEIPACSLRELTVFGEYGEMGVVGRCDRIYGPVVEDDKTSSFIDIEEYIDGYQWRFYLDMFDADIFRWRIWCMKEVKPKTWIVEDTCVFEQYRYPSLHDDCMSLAQEFHEFAKEHLWKEQGN
jgi:hypothetical protein